VRQSSYIRTFAELAMGYIECLKWQLINHLLAVAATHTIMINVEQMRNLGKFDVCANSEYQALL